MERKVTVEEITNFNSHAHVERDVYCKHYGGTIEISTHTLTWSVTWLSWFGTYLYNISTHTLTWSVTDWEEEAEYYVEFQLTRSRGAWRFAMTVMADHMNFNSHAHVERDLINPFN